MSFVQIIASGLYSVFNRILVTGLVTKALFGAFFVWVIGALVAGIVSLIEPFFAGLGQFGTILGTMGDMGQLVAWAFGFMVLPGLAPVIAARVIRFCIRRLPVIG